MPTYVVFCHIDDLHFSSFANGNLSYSYLSTMSSILGQPKAGINKTFD